jgi:hypothetical protein
VESSTRSAQRNDFARMEFKGASIWAETHEQYLLDFLKVMEKIMLKPEAIEQLMGKVDELYKQDSRLLHPNQFYEFKDMHDQADCVAADDYHIAARAFLPKAQKLFDEILHQPPAVRPGFSGLQPPPLPNVEVRRGTFGPA